MAKKIKGEKGKVYVLMGDGECQEGTTWESMLIAGRHKLDNLVVIVDWNKIQGSGRTNDVLPLGLNDDSITEIARHLNWRTSNIDGHNIDDLRATTSADLKGHPYMIIANTIKGKGVSFMEDKPEWHAKWLDDKHEAIAMRELGSNNINEHEGWQGFA